MLTLSAHALERFRERWPDADMDAELGEAESLVERGPKDVRETVITGRGVGFVVEHGFVLTVLPKRKR